MPLVFHTGPRPWTAHRQLADLLDGPEILKGFAPQVKPLFWDLAERTPDELLESGSSWLEALAVVRAEQEEPELFREIMAEALRRIEDVSDAESVRWHDLVQFIIHWAVRRRSPAERGALIAAAEASQAVVRHREEVHSMSVRLWKTADEEWEERTKAASRESELAERRADLLELLEERFGAVPAPYPRALECRHRCGAAPSVCASGTAHSVAGGARPLTSAPAGLRGRGEWEQLSARTSFATLPSTPSPPGAALAPQGVHEQNKACLLGTAS